MSFRKRLAKWKEKRLSMRTKLLLSLCAIAAVLLLSSLISVMEYRSMSSYVSDMIADNINSINVAQKLADVSNRYNLDILAVIGDEKTSKLPDFDADAFLSRCDSLRSSLSSRALMPLADSVEYAYSAYMLTSLELQGVLLSDFIDSRSWYFERLQPRFNRLRHDIDALTSAIYRDLSANSETFEDGFYRSIIPGIVAVGAGLLLVFLLFFYLIVNYVNPLRRMRDELRSYRSYGKKYTYDFAGDDELGELNADISELARDNQQLRHRISAMRRGGQDEPKA